MATAGGDSAARPVLPPVLVAVVGGGRMGNIRLAALAANPRTQVSVFVDADEAVAEATGARYGVPWRQSLADALADFRNTVAVWVATPTPTHTNLIADAAAAGLHVAVEKPVADSLGGVAAAYAAARAARVHLYCAFQRRFDPGYSAVASAVTRGTIGTISSAVGVFRDHPPPPASFFESGGGDLYLDLGVHDVDFLCHTLGEVPVGVVATESQSGPQPPIRQSPAPPADAMADGMPMSSIPGAPGSGGGSAGGATAAADLPATAASAAGETSPRRRPVSANVGSQEGATGVLNLWYPSGVVATLLLSRVSATGYDQRLEVHGSLGSARVDNPTSHGAVLSSAGGSSVAPAPHSFPQRFREAFAAEVEHFADLVLGKIASPIVSEADTAVSLAVALAGGMSAADGGRPVRLAEVWGDAPPQGSRGGKRRRGGSTPAARVPVLFNADGQPRRRPGRPKGSRNRKTLEKEEAAAAAAVAALVWVAAAGGTLVSPPHSRGPLPAAVGAAASPLIL